MPLKVLPGVLPLSQFLLQPPGWDGVGLSSGRVGEEGVVHPGEELSPRIRSRDEMGFSRVHVPLAV